MTRLLVVTAIIEAPTGLALLVVPSIVVRLLLGSPLEASPAKTLGRVAGAALLTLGVACWLARNDTQGTAARGLVAAMMLYNISTVVILGAVGVGSQPIGMALWPAVVLHAVMTGCCILILLTEKRGEPAPLGPTP
jgi:hypothetical protein